MDAQDDRDASAEYYTTCRPTSEVSGMKDSPSRVDNLDTLSRTLESFPSPFQQASQAELPDTPTQLLPAASADIPSHILRFSSDSRTSSEFGRYSGSFSLENARPGTSGRGHVDDSAGVNAIQSRQPVFDFSCLDRTVNFKNKYLLYSLQLAMGSRNTLDEVSYYPPLLTGFSFA